MGHVEHWQLPFFISKIKLRLECFRESNALAYLKIMAQKYFDRLAPDRPLSFGFGPNSDNPGSNVIKLFTPVIYECLKKA
jgi:hypothetical protein